MSGNVSGSPTPHQDWQQAARKGGSSPHSPVLGGGPYGDASSPRLGGGLANNMMARGSPPQYGAWRPRGRSEDLLFPSLDPNERLVRGRKKQNPTVGSNMKGPKCEKGKSKSAGGGGHETAGKSAGPGKKQGGGRPDQDGWWRGETGKANKGGAPKKTGTKNDYTKSMFDAQHSDDEASIAASGPGGKGVELDLDNFVVGGGKGTTGVGGGGEHIPFAGNVEQGASSSSHVNYENDRQFGRVPDDQLNDNSREEGSVEDLDPRFDQPDAPPNTQVEHGGGFQVPHDPNYDENDNYIGEGDEQDYIRQQMGWTDDNWTKGTSSGVAQWLNKNGWE